MPGYSLPRLMRSVKLTSSTSPALLGNGGTERSRARRRLLTYPMALAQPTATLPLLQSSSTEHHPGSSSASSESSRGMKGLSVDAYSSWHHAHNTRALAHHCSSSNGNSGNNSNHDSNVNDNCDDFCGGNTDLHDIGRNDVNAHTQFSRALQQSRPRRWVRDVEELCVSSMRRSSNVNHINTYVATYKLNDPQWRPFLLPEVHIVPDDDIGDGNNNSSQTRAPCNKSSTGKGYDVFIDYSKLTTLELLSRHANYALRHLVQKGHAMYLVNYAQHSILHLRGLVECSYITCSYGIRGERLRTYLTHVGPLDVRDVLQFDPRNPQSVSIDLTRSHVQRGVVALSQVEGYGTWFQRKPMLWQRTRRIGALQSQLGTLDYTLCAPSSVGRLRDYEVSVLSRHMRCFAHAGGGATASAIIASSQVAQNERLYLGQFDAPAMTAMDAVQQLVHKTALSHRLLTPVGAARPKARSAESMGNAWTEVSDVSESRDADLVSSGECDHSKDLGANGDGGSNKTSSSRSSRNKSDVSRHSESSDVSVRDGETGEEGNAATVGVRGSSAAESCSRTQSRALLREQLSMERFLAVSWVTRTPPPYVPLEADLPFTIQLSKPAVFVSKYARHNNSNSVDDVGRALKDSSSSVTFPTGGAVGSPWVEGVPLSLFEYHIHQGVEHYVYDDAPSARPLKWWNQPTNMPYSGYLYGMRSQLLNKVRPNVEMANPLVRSQAISTLHRHGRRNKIRAAMAAGNAKLNKKMKLENKINSVQVAHPVSCSNSSKDNQKNADDSSSAMHEQEEWYKSSESSVGFACAHAERWKVCDDANEDEEEKCALVNFGPAARKARMEEQQQQRSESSTDSGTVTTSTTTTAVTSSPKQIPLHSAIPPTSAAAARVASYAKMAARTDEAQKHLRQLRVSLVRRALQRRLRRQSVRQQQGGEAAKQT